MQQEFLIYEKLTKRILFSPFPKSPTFDKAAQVVRITVCVLKEVLFFCLHTFPLYPKK